MRRAGLEEHAVAGTDLGHGLALALATADPPMT
jgi:hypothetical protein